MQYNCTTAGRAQPSSDVYWEAMVVLSTVTMFATPAVYYAVAKYYFKVRGEG